MLIFLLTLTKKVSILTSFSLLKKVSALSSKLTKKVSFEVRGVHSPQLGQWSEMGSQFIAANTCQFQRYQTRKNILGVIKSG